MKTFIMFIVVGAILGAAEGGAEGVSIGVIGGFCFWLFIKIVKYFNRRSTLDKIEEEINDD